MKKSRLTALLLALMICVFLLPALAEGQTEKGGLQYYNAGKLKPVYEEQDDGSAQAGELQKGQEFTLLSQDKKWAQIAYMDPAGQERTGYVKVSNLKEQAKSHGTAFIKGPDDMSKVPLRKSAKKSGTVLGKYYSGVLADLLEEPGEKYTKVRIGSVTGFIETAYLKTRDAEQEQGFELMTATVSNPDNYSLTLREGASYKSEKFRGYQNGTTVLVLGVTEEFVHVLTPDGRTGFMMATGLTPSPAYADLDPKNITERPKGYTSVIDNPGGEGAHLRRRGSTASESMGLYRNGTEVVVTGGTTWWKKVWVDGYTGYMMAKFIRGFVPSEDESDGSSDQQFKWDMDSFNNPPGWDEAVSSGDGVDAPEGE